MRDAILERRGAFVMGRNMYGPIRGEWDENWRGWWGDDPPYHAPVFVLTHFPHEPIVMTGGTTFHFVTDGFDSALGRRGMPRASWTSTSPAARPRCGRRSPRARSTSCCWTSLRCCWARASGSSTASSPSSPSRSRTSYSPLVTHIRYLVVGGGGIVPRSSLELQLFSATFNAPQAVVDAARRFPSGTPSLVATSAQRRPRSRSRRGPGGTAHRSWRSPRRPGEEAMVERLVRLAAAADRPGTPQVGQHIAQDRESEVRRLPISRSTDIPPSRRAERSLGPPLLYSSASPSDRTAKP